MVSLSLTFLGTSAAVPTLRRNVSSLCLRVDAKVLWLFDCGEGTQMQLQKVPGLKAPKISRIFLTHLHADHVLGLPGLLCTIYGAWQNNSNGNNTNSPTMARFFPSDSQRIHIYGPPGTRQYIINVLENSKSEPVKDIIVVHELLQLPLQAAVSQPMIASDDIYPETASPDSLCWWSVIRDEEGESITVKAMRIQHVVDCFGYIIQEKPKLDSLKLQSFGNIPTGPLCSQPMQGRPAEIRDFESSNVESMTATHSHQFSVKDQIQRTRKLVILGDTCDPSEIAPLAMDADVLVHESTYHDDTSTGGRLVEMARRVGHSTAVMAGEFAKKIRAKQLILTHFSPRYVDDLSAPLSATSQPRKNAVYLSAIKQQAEEAFGSDRVEVARDCWTFTVPDSIH